MSVVDIRTLNRFPLHGTHLSVLQASHDGRPLTAHLPPATGRRALNDLVAWGVLGRGASRGTFYVTDHALVQAVAAATQERSDLTTLLATPAALAVLSSLPVDRVGLGAALAGVSPPTWRDHAQRLHEAGAVRRRGRHWTISESLPALGRLVAAYRDLHAHWDDAWSTPADERGSSTYLPIHVRGVEAAWRLQNARVHGIPVVDDAFFDPIVAPYQVAYRSGRDIDLLDRALLWFRAHADLDHRQTFTARTNVDPRIVGLLRAGITDDALGDPRVLDRFDLYGLTALAALLLRDPPSCHAFALDFRRQGTQEDALG